MADDHDDAIKWKHFLLYWPCVRGIHRSPLNSPHKGQWRGASMFPLICACINVWANNRGAGDLRRHRAHYDVTVMGPWKSRGTSSADRLSWQHSVSCWLCKMFGTFAIIGFNHGVLGLAENPARGTGFWSQNTEGVARGVLTEKARPEGWVFSQAQHPMIKTYYNMFLHCNTTIAVFKLLAIVKWKRQRADISSRHCCYAKQPVAKEWLPSNIHHWKAFHSFSDMT